MLDAITPLILTRDEEANIARTLGQLTWAKEIVIVDSLSTDRTLEIARRFPNVRIVQRELDTLAGQTTFGLREVRTSWALLLDADYFVTDDLIRELAGLAPPPELRGFLAAFDYAIGGRRLRASLYPPRPVLLQPDACTIWQDGHTPRIRVNGETAMLRGKIIHDDRKPFSRFLDRQRRYMRQEAVKLRAADPRTLNGAARVRKLIVVAPFAVLVHTLFVKGLILDGVAGLHYTLERVVAECILSWELLRSYGSSDRP